VHFNCRTNDFPAAFVCPLMKWMHERKSLWKTAKKENFEFGFLWE